jgi:trehalose 6-phosphate phosphatase
MSAPPENLSSSDIALFLDVDGTLVDIQDHPQDVVASAMLIDRLERLAARLDGALALVSGRSLGEIDRMFRPALFPAAGAHGAELRFQGGVTRGAAATALPDAVIHRLESFVSESDGLLLEHKPAGASLHYRRAPQLESRARVLVERILDELGPDYRLIDGKMVLEIAPSAHGKGEAIRTFMQRSPYRGRRPVFLGDDVTDEDGFGATNELDGISVKVGGGIDSAARYRLAGVDQVRDWIDRAFIDDGP